ncbi:MAG: alpha-galactosidase [Anaerolineales bacterium]|nr:alpha-galactosidase [Anaerolineales bacterium]
MKIELPCGTYQLPVDCAASQETNTGYLLNGTEISIELPFRAQQYYRHGWQSWSLTAWLPAAQRIPVSRPTIFHPLQTDPGYAYAKTHNGSWVGAVQTPGGEVLVLGALEIETHVFLEGNRLAGRVETGEPATWYLAMGPEDLVFARYAELLGERFGTGLADRPPWVWCSWYSLYSEIDEEKLLHILEEQKDLPFEVFQVDDGWEKKVGDWEANHKFPSGMGALAEKIHAAGRTPGLWLAPLLVVPSSNLYQQHPDWLLRDKHRRPVSAGFNFFEQLYALDTTHPDALAWLADLMKKVRDWGFDYLKLDFLYAGALPGRRYLDMPREAAYRHGLSVIRKALGDAYLLTCGAPVVPSLGLCDGIRVGPDVAGHWESQRDTRLFSNYAIPGTRNAIRTTLNRLWLKPIVHTDPDVVYFRSHAITMTDRHKSRLQTLAQICGFKATSDLPAWLLPEERQRLLQFFGHQPKIKKKDRYKFQLDDQEIDFTETVQVPENTPWDRLLGFLLGSVGNLPFILKINAHLARKQVQKELKQETK